MRKSVVFFLCFVTSGAAQCLVDFNMPERLFWGVTPMVHAFPRLGAWVFHPGYWTPMPLDGIRYIPCTAGPSSYNCQSAGSDHSWDSFRQTFVDSAMRAWNDTRYTNGSQLTYYNGLHIGADPVWSVRLNRLNQSSMSRYDYWGEVVSTAFKYTNYHGDRIAWAEIDIREDLSGGTLEYVVAHEIGHLMGLGDCPSCIFSVMSYQMHETKPTGCDLLQVAAAFP